MTLSVKKLFYILPALILHLGAVGSHNHSSTNIIRVKMPNIKEAQLGNVTRSMISMSTTQKFHANQKHLLFSSSLDLNFDISGRTEYGNTTQIKVTKPNIHTKTAKRNSYSFSNQLPNVSETLLSTSNFEIQTIVISKNTYKLSNISKAYNVTELKTGRLKKTTKTKKQSSAKYLLSKSSESSRTTPHSSEVNKKMNSQKMETVESTKSDFNDIIIGATTVLPENTDSRQDIKRRQYPGQFQFPGKQFPLPGAQAQNGAGQYQNNQYSASQFRNPGPPQQYQKDENIERLLAEYRGIVNKYGSNTQEPVPDPPQNGQYNQMPTPRRGRLRDYEDMPSGNIPFMGAWGRQDSMGRQGRPGGPPGGGPGGGRPGGPPGGPPPGKAPPGDEDKLPPGASGGMLTNGASTSVPGEGGPNDPMATQQDKPENAAAGAATRFTTRITTTRRKRRTTPNRISLEEDCDYLAYYCLKAYDTGFVCGRTLFFNHLTFKNYCMLDYVNCMERYDIWQVAHMGECFAIKLLTEYLHYPYADDYFLDQYYIVEDM